MAVRPGGAIDPAERIIKLLDKEEKAIRAVFLAALAVIKDAVTLDELAELIASGRIVQALNAIETAALVLADGYGEALSVAARDTAAFLSTQALTVTVSFDQSNQRAVDVIRENRFRLIREFTADQRQMLRTSLARSVERGLNPRDAAREFRASIGLTTKQEAAVAKYRSLLERAGTEPGALEALTRKLRDKRFDRSVRRAVREGIPLTPEQIDKMVSKYRQRYIKYRSEVIGRTEALRAVHEGKLEMYNQAFETGALSPDEIEDTWVSARDERVRHSHARLNGQKRPEDGTWDGNDGPLRYPGDPNASANETVQCRCVLSTRLTPLEDAGAGEILVTT